MKEHTLTFRVPLLPPSVNSCWRKRARGGFYLTEQANAFITAVGHLSPKVTLQPPYEVRLVFGFPENKLLRTDLDNLLKLSLDSLTKAGIIKDDRHIRKITAEKWIAVADSAFGTEYTVSGFLL